MDEIHTSPNNKSFGSTVLDEMVNKLRSTNDPRRRYEYVLWLAKKLQALGLSVLTESLRSPHFLSAQLPTDTNPHLLSQLEKKGVYLSERGGSLRITPHLWNNSEDFDIFIFELSAAL